MLGFEPVLKDSLGDFLASFHLSHILTNQLYQLLNIPRSCNVCLLACYTH